jgi:hypothetical protein
MYIGFSPVSFIPPLLHTHFPLDAAPTRTKWRSLENCTKQCSFVYRRALDKQILSFLVVLFRNIIFIIDSNNLKKKHVQNIYIYKRCYT